MHWQPIESAPKDGSNVLVRYTYTQCKGVCPSFIAEVWWGNPLGCWLLTDGCGRLNGIAKHWMPLPEPPNE